MGSNVWVNLSLRMIYRHLRGVGVELYLEVVSFNRQSLYPRGKTTGTYSK